MADEPAVPPKRTRTKKAAVNPEATPSAPAASFEAAEVAAAIEAEAEAEATPNRSGIPSRARLADAPATPPVRILRGGVSELTADSVEVRLGGIGALDGNEVFVQWGGIGAAKAERVGVEFGSVGAALAGEVSVSQGFAGAVLAREVVVEQAIARTVVAQQVRFTRPSAVLVLIAAKVEGDVRPLLDWRGALAAGAVFGAIVAVAKAAREARVRR
jgi:hypothetical protein